MKRFILSVILLVLSCSVQAYDPKVHAEMTEQAVVISEEVLDFGRRLGVNVEELRFGKPLSEWAGDGAVDQDSNLMFLNHFFDAQNEKPLTVKTLACTSPWANARDWALDLSPHSITHMKDRYVSAVIHPHRVLRDKQVATLFYQLGHAVHLIQDMAQPEHTRNDPHLPDSLLWVPLPPLAIEPNGAPWEIWSRVYLLCEDLGGDNAGCAARKTLYQGYEIPDLPGYGSYFHTDSGKGMADFSALNYVTQHTNYDDVTDGTNCLPHFDPKLDQTSYRDIVVTEWVKTAFGNEYPITIKERIYESTIWDSYTGGWTPDYFHTVYSAIDFELDQWVGKKVYSLNKASYLSRVGQLAPRAVGYSAGLIKHFFRGEISAEWIETSSLGVYDLKITNLSDEAIGDGTTMVAAYRPGEQYLGGKMDLAIIHEATIDSIPPGGTLLVQNVEVPGLKAGDQINDFETRIVLRGPLGQEPDDVTSLVLPAQPKLTERILDWRGDAGGSSRFTKPHFFFGSPVAVFWYMGQMINHPEWTLGMKLFGTTNGDSNFGGKIWFDWRGAKAVHDPAVWVFNGGDFQTTLVVLLSESYHYNHGSKGKREITLAPKQGAWVEFTAEDVERIDVMVIKSFRRFFAGALKWKE